MTPTPPPAPTGGAGRACGTCDLCCRLPSIDWPEFPELHKPADALCIHLRKGKGCAIHADRPMHCASFQCLWLMGFGPEELRPDKIGGFFDAVDSGTLILVTDKAVPDPRTLPPVARFIAEWNAKRKSRLLVYRGGIEVKDRPPRPREGGPGRPDRSGPSR